MTALDSLLAKQGYRCELLTPDHLLMDFDAGDRGEALSSWLLHHAEAYQQEGLCKVWVLRPLNNETAVRGYFTLSAHSIKVEVIGKRDRVVLRENGNRVNGLPVLPAQLLGKFALDESVQGGEAGALLMMTVFDRYLAAEKSVGCKFLVIDVQEPNLVAYYTDRFGFKASSHLQGGLTALYLTTENLRQQYDEVFSE